MYTKKDVEKWFKGITRPIIDRYNKRVAKQIAYMTELTEKEILTYINEMKDNGGTN
jgi:hypothetical protein